MTIPEPTTAESWAQANHRYLRTEAERLRLLLRRKVLWLRHQYGKEPLQTYQGLVISEGQVDRLLAPADLSHETRFFQSNPQALEIRKSLERVDSDIRQQLAALAASDQRPALDVLARLFGLSRFARDLLLACLAADLDPAFERLYGYVQDDATRKFPTLHLLRSLLTTQETEALQADQELMSHMPLRLHRLIRIEAEPTSLASCPLRLTERVRDYLLGFNRIEDGVAAWLRPVPPAPLGKAHQQLAEHITGRLGPADWHGWPLINLVGPRGSGRRAIAREVCERLQLQLLELNLNRLPAPGPDRQEAFRLIERDSRLAQFALYVDATERPLDAAFRFLLSETIEQLGLILVVGSSERITTGRRALALPVSRLNAEAQREIWLQALGNVPHNVDGRIDEIIEQFRLGPAAIASAVASAASQNQFLAGNPEPVSLNLLWDACRAEATAPLDDLAQRIIPCHDWNDIVLPEDILGQLHEIAEQIAHRPRVYETWGFGAKLNRGRGISALFSGPSGTGKTLAAEILANHLKLDLYRIDLSGVVSKYIGETEKNLRNVFNAAEDSGSILFFDEADALFGKRSEVKDSHDRYANIEINYLLQRMEEYRGLAILATNMKSHLDQAFLRRLRFVVEFPFPDAVHRAHIWERVVPSGAPVEGLNYMALAQMEIAGGNIKNIAVNAAFLASAESRSICMEHVIRAARREYAKIEKLPSQREFQDLGTSDVY